MLNGMEEDFSGFLIHAYPDTRRNRLYLLGRLTTGKSFAAVIDDKIWKPRLHIFEDDYPRVMPLFKNFQIDDSSQREPLDSFSGKKKLICFDFLNYSERLRAAELLEKEQIKCPDAGIKPADLFLIEKQIKGPLILSGIPCAGKRVDFIFKNPKISAPRHETQTPLRIASVDIETDVKSSAIRAVSIAWADTYNNEIQINNDASGETFCRVRVLFPNNSIFGASRSSVYIFHADEKSLLCAFLDDIKEIDPDILTGWNFLDFDFPHLVRRFEYYNIPFTIGRSRDSAKFFPGSDTGTWKKRSAAAIVPGRQVLDALRIVRSGAQGSRAISAGGLTLDEVAHNVLGEGKTIHETGDEKIAALDRLYFNDPKSFAEYCLRDAQLVLKILSKTGMYRLTIERASLTGVSLDKAWTSVVSFERIYAMELSRRKISAPVFSEKDVSGASGGTVLDAEAGLFNNVAVFDFRSLYPAIIRTFNIDPLSYARAGNKDDKKIVAPNGAGFSRNPGVLPALIAEYFAKRKAAFEKGDAVAAQVYKILMNSFYGVLGTSACRYGKSALAGAITSFARKWLLFSRDWFNSRGLHVLYGDTDSLFVQTGLDDVPLAEFKKYCVDLANEINMLITKTIKKDYDLESFLELRFEKAYRRFLIPPVRNIHASGDSRQKQRAESRGRAKGYGGYLLNSDGSLSVDVVGMEAVRSDATPLARRLQLELLEIVFSGCNEKEFRQKVEMTIKELRSGILDHELVYRKRLTRFPETYTASTPPQVKAARALGWKKRRGTVEYLWTVNGPEPFLRGQSEWKLDYEHYIETQIFPLVRSIAAAAKWDAGFFVTRKDNESSGSQIELMF